MKKMILIGLGVGIFSIAQATSVSLVQGNSNGSVQLSGNNAYLYYLQINLSPGQTISSAEIDFNNVELVSTDAKDTVNDALVMGNIANHSYTDNDSAGDYFTAGKANQFYTLTGLQGTAIGSQKQFAAPQWVPAHWSGGTYVPGYYIYDTETWSDVFSASQLGSIATGGTFDIGIDPDCLYDVLGSIKFTYTTVTSGDHTVPDQAMTAVLLGIGFLGMFVFRRKFALQ